MNKQSFVEVDSELLAKACQASLEEIKQTRKQKVEEAIDEMMNKRFFKPKNREDALKQLKDSTDCIGISVYDTILWYGEVREEVSENLLGMSKLSDKVYLCRSDYNRLDRFFE